MSNSNYNNIEYRHNSGYLKVARKYKCENCGSIKSSIETHHKDGNSLNNHINNLMLLCKNCHNIVHKGKINIE